MGKRKLPYYLTKQEINSLIKVFNLRYPTGQRNCLIVRTFVNTGLRLSELIDLKWKNISFVEGSIQVKEGKGNKDRKVWFDDDLKQRLVDWKKRQIQELIQRDLDSSDYVFTTLKGTKLDPKYIRRMIYEKAAKSGIQEVEEKINKNGDTYLEKKVSPHTLRHTYATQLLRRGADIRQVQKSLGHENLETTMIYTHVYDSDLENLHKTLSLGSDRNWKKSWNRFENCYY